MKRMTTFLFILVLLVFSAMPSSAQELQQSQTTVTATVELPEWWGKISPADRRQLVSKFTARALENIASGNEVRTFQEIGSLYPYTGVGVAFRPAVFLKDSIVRVLRLQITAVFTESPAATAGLRPGDWLVQVNDTKSCTADVTALDSEEEQDRKIKLLQDCAETLRQAFQSAPEPFTVLVERDGELLTAVVLARALIGSEIAVFVEQRLDGLRLYFTPFETQLQDLQGRIDEAGEDEEKLDACMRSYLTIRDGILQPRRELLAFIRRLQQTMPEE